MPNDDPRGDADELSVLMALRLASFAEADRVAAVFDQPVDAVVDVLSRLEQADLARHRDGRVSGWMLTPTGRSEGERLAAEALDRNGARADLVAAYERFLALNPRLLEVCSAWQLREVDGQQVANDHADAAHDARVVAQLGDIDDAAQPVVADMARAVPRFGRYGGRLAEARRRVEGGEGDWFARPTIDGYHTVWFELHEHLLATLGIERGSERTDDSGSAGT
ncbi:MAG: transcriptional regulator [Acidimicrobiia bacterium]|nr:transcriptional regulator [Acidimicrobiia bacterium]